nr:hypothetical protein [Paenibacillus monticola]
MEQSVRNVFMNLELAYPSDISILIEQPANAEHGDYSSSIALQLAKLLRKSPMAIAELVKTELQLQDNITGLVERIEVAAPGFINLYIHWQEWARQPFALPQDSGQKVVIEHTSINPNKAGYAS